MTKSVGHCKVVGPMDENCWQKRGKKKENILTKDALSCSKSNISFSYCSASSLLKMIASSHIYGEHRQPKNEWLESLKQWQSIYLLPAE